MGRKTSSLLVGILMLGAASASNASVIDLIGLPDNFDQGTFGTSATNIFAQSVTADDVNWASLRFGASSISSGTFELIITGSRPGSGLPGTGRAPAADNILFQATQSHSGSGLEFFDLDLNLGVTVDDVLFFVLAGVDAAGNTGTLASASVRATDFNGPTDQYTFGEFIFSGGEPFSNTITYSSRFSQNEDLAFRAEFNSGAVVPLPAALPLALSGFALLGVIGWRRRVT